MRRWPASAVLAVALLSLGLPTVAPAQPLFGPTQDPLAGSRVFGSKGCARCHAVKGVGGGIGPDLGRIARPRSFYDLAAAMWNHMPRMSDRMRQLGIPRPALDRTEAGDLIAFLFTLDYFDTPGDAAAGQRLFAAKRCIVCHQVGGVGGVLGPNLDLLGQYGSPIFVAAAMWNHGPAMSEAMRARPAHGLVLLRRHDPVPVHGAGGHGHPAPLLLPAERRGGVRVRPVRDGRGGVRLARAVHALLGGQPDDLRPLRPPVQRAAPEGLPAATGAHVGLGRGAHGPRPGLRVHRLPPPVERARILRDGGRHGDHGRRPARGAVPPAAHPRGGRGHRRHAHALLRDPRRRPPGAHRRAAGTPPLPGPEAGHERSPERRAAGRSAAHDAVRAGLPPPGPRGLAPGPGGPRRPRRLLPGRARPESRPFAPAPVGIKPEWYFMFMFQTLKYLPGHILGIEGEVVGVVGFGVGGVLLLLVPFLDRSAARGTRSRLLTSISLGLLAYMLLLTYLGYTVSPTR